MKKLLFLFAAIGLTTFSACEGPEGPQGPAGTNVNAEVFELQNVNFALSNGQYSIYRTLNPNILDSDTMLIYRLTDLIDSQTPIWQLIPRTIYFANSADELDYDYDFSKEDFQIYAGGNFDISTEPDYLNNQTFRIVIIPGTFSDKNSNHVNFNDYNAVVHAYGLTAANIKTIH